MCYYCRYVSYNRTAYHGCVSLKATLVGLKAFEVMVKERIISVFCFLFTDSCFNLFYININLSSFKDKKLS